MIRDTLTAQQLRAVDTRSAHVVLVAGAGSGKTKTLTCRLARLLVEERVHPDRILAVTFTRAAAREMRERLDRMLDAAGGFGAPPFRTLHSWAAALLREHAERIGRSRGFQIYSEEDTDEILRWSAYDAGDRDAWRRRLSTLKKDKDALALFAARLRGADALTFDTIETLTYELLVTHADVRDAWKLRYDHVFVDEFQDTNLTQVAILNEILPRNLFVVGDPRQAIYGFRGAEPGTIVRYAREDERFEVIDLPHNFRSRAEIIDYANTAVDGDWVPMVPGREAVESDASVVRCYQVRDQPVEAHQILADLLTRYEPRDVFVLARTWRPLSALAEILRAQGVPIDYLGAVADVWNTPGGRWVARLARLVAHPADDNLVQLLAEAGRGPGCWRFTAPSVTALRVAAVKNRRRLIDLLAEVHEGWRQVVAFLPLAGEATASECLNVLVDHLGRSPEGEELPASWRDDVERAVRELAHPRVRDMSVPEFLDYLLYRSNVEKLDVNRNAVRLMSIHASKGLEAKAVIVLDAYDGIFPGRGAEAERAEDLRIWYVACTRAQDDLVIVVPTDRVHPFTGVVEPVRPSPFLDRGNRQVPLPWVTT